jgi:hypothetical protein
LKRADISRCYSYVTGLEEGCPLREMIPKNQNEVQLRDASLRKESVSNKTYFNSLLSSGLMEDGVSSQLEADRRSKFVVA